MRRSFWALVAVALLGEAVAAALAWRALAVELPCHIDGVQISVSSMAACVKPAPLIGRHALLPAMAIGTVVAATLLVAGVELARQLLRLHKVHRELRRLPRLAGSVPVAPSFPPRRLLVVDIDQLHCFTIGLLRPVVVVSSGLVRTLTTDELHAALCHESVHARRHDPLRVLAASIASAAVFFAPVLKDLERGARVAEEFEADRLAAERFGAIPLLSALRRLIGSDTPGRAPMSSMAGSTALPERIAALDGLPLRLTLGRVRLATTMASALLLVGLGLSVPTDVASPRPLAVHRVGKAPVSPPRGTTGTATVLPLDAHRAGN